MEAGGSGNLESEKPVTPAISGIEHRSDHE